MLVILALLAGGTLFGFFGLLLAVPAMAAVKIIVSHLWRTHVLGEPIEEIVAEQAAADARGEGFVADVGGEEAKGLPHKSEPEREIEPGIEPELEIDLTYGPDLGGDVASELEPELEPERSPTQNPSPRVNPRRSLNGRPNRRPSAVRPSRLAGQGAPGTRVIRDGR